MKTRIESGPSSRRFWIRVIAISVGLHVWSLVLVALWLANLKFSLFRFWSISAEDNFGIGVIFDFGERTRVCVTSDFALSKF